MSGCGTMKSDMDICLMITDQPVCIMFKFIFPCLRPLECNENNKIRFLMKGEKICFKENIPAFSVQGKSRSISVLQKNLVTII